jgi:hypothetical protein
MQNKAHKNSKNITVAVIMTSLLGIFIALFLLSPNLTGNVISNTNQNSNNIISILFITASLIGSYVYFKKR